MRLIDADLLKEKIEELMPRWNKEEPYGMGRINSYEFVIDVIDNSPTVKQD